MKKSYIIGGLIIIGALIFAMFSFKSTLTSYVTIKEAKNSEQYVQIAGILVKGTTNYDVSKNLMIFKLKEPNDGQMVVHYNKSKPANFEDADKIVAVGKFDKHKNAFIADELLVKCPSKYEGRISKE